MYTYSLLAQDMKTKLEGYHVWGVKLALAVPADGSYLYDLYFKDTKGLAFLKGRYSGFLYDGPETVPQVLLINCPEINVGQLDLALNPEHTNYN